MTSKNIPAALFVMMLLTSLFYFAVNVGTVKAEPRTWVVDDDGPAEKTFTDPKERKPLNQITTENTYI